MPKGFNLQEMEEDTQASEDQPSPLEEAAAELDTSEGPPYFTDFFKCILHPRSVLEIPLLGPLEPPAGFGEITADEKTHSQVHIATPDPSTLTRSLPALLCHK